LDKTYRWRRAYSRAEIVYRRVLRRTGSLVALAERGAGDAARPPWPRPLDVEAIDLSDLGDVGERVVLEAYMEVRKSLKLDETVSLGLPGLMVVVGT
jgi:hypothetical protein